LEYTVWSVKRVGLPVNFLSHISTAMLTRDIDIGIPFVCPCVCQVPVLYRNCLTYRHGLFTVR